VVASAGERRRSADCAKEHGVICEASNSTWGRWTAPSARRAGAQRRVSGRQICCLDDPIGRMLVLNLDDRATDSNRRADAAGVT
jgi:hypothetical protein